MNLSRNDLADPSGHDANTAIDASPKGRSRKESGPARASQSSPQVAVDNLGGASPLSHRKPRILDLFCGAGGAAMGYRRAGFAVTGIDHAPQPDYPFEFIQADVMQWLARRSGFLRFDAIHASPPCQAFSAMTQVAGTRDQHPDLLTPIRDWLQRIGLPYVIENVPGAPVQGHVTLCGTAFGLGAGEYELRRHRH